MRKVIFAINETIDGYADHTSGIVDAELHDFFTGFFDSVDTILFGRKTYQLMESYWPKAHEDPQCTKSELKFAEKINSIRKIVFSNTLKEVNWNNSRLAKSSVIEEIKKLKTVPGKNISVSGLILAATLMNLGLIDEYLFLIHPIVAGNGRRLFEKFEGMSRLQLADTQKLNSGVVVLHYENK